MKALLILILIGIMGYAMAPMVIENPLFILALLLTGFILFISLTNFEFSLMILLLIIPFSLQAKLGSVAGEASLNIGIDDFFISAMFVIWLVYLSKTRSPALLPTPLNMPFVVYFTACVMSFVPLMISGKGSIELSVLHLVKWYEYVFIYFVLCTTLIYRTQVVRFTVLSIVTAILVGLFHFSQILWGLMQGQPAGALVMWATAGFKSNGILGAYYVLFLSIMISFFLQGRKFRSKTVLFIFASLLCFNLYYTFARSAYVGFVISLLFLGSFYRKPLAIAGLLALGIVPVFLSKEVSRRVTYTFQADPAQLRSLGYNVPSHVQARLKNRPIPIQLDASSMERLVNWKKVKKVVYENFLFGTGYWSGRFLGLFGFSTAHNFYLTVFMETGLFGMLSFIWLSGAVISMGLKLANSTEDWFFIALGRGLAAGYIGILVHAFFGETFEDFRITGPLWMLCGIVYAASKIASQKQAKTFPQAVPTMGRF